MSKRTRSVEWVEGRIVEILAKSKPTNLPTSLALCSMVMKFEVRSIEEQHNFDMALYNLIKRGMIVQAQDERGFQILKLVA
jgi:hypothetical protein